jgi:tetratricopeptide (TPR) repeat protein
MLLDRYLVTGGSVAAAFMGCLIGLSGTALAARGVPIGEMRLSDRQHTTIGPIEQPVDIMEGDPRLNYPVITGDRVNFDKLNLLAAADYAAGRYGDAERRLLLARVIAHNVFPSSDPALFLATANLALVYRAEGRTFAAIVMCTRALNAAEIAVGPRHAWVARLAAHLAMIYAEKGQFAEAELLFKRAIAIEENSPGQDSAFLSQAFLNLSAVYLRQSHLAEAEALLERSLAFQLPAYGLNCGLRNYLIDRITFVYQDEFRDLYNKSGSGGSAAQICSQ